MDFDFETAIEQENSRVGGGKMGIKVHLRRGNASCSAAGRTGAKKLFLVLFVIAGDLKAHALAIPADTVCFIKVLQAGRPARIRPCRDVTSRL